MISPFRGLSPFSRPRFAAAGGGGFSPADLAGFRLWLRNTLALSNNDPIATWPDSSGNADDAAQATSGRRPLYKTGVFGSEPAALFDGSADVMTLGSAIALAGAFSLYAVGIRNAAGQIWCPLGNNSNSAGIIIYTDNNLYVSNDANASVSMGWPGPNGTGFLLTIQRDGSNSVTARISGGSPTTLGTLSGTITLASVGARDFNGFFTNGHIAEEALYNSFHNSTDRAAGDAYFTTKYGF